MSPDADTIAPLAQLDRALMRILDQVRDQTGARRASLFLRDPETGEAVTRVAHLTVVEEIRVPPGQGIVGAVLDRDAEIIWPVEEDLVPLRAVSEATGYHPTAIFALPVRIEDVCVGVLEIIDGPLDDTALRRGRRLALRIQRILERSSLGSQLRPRGERPVRLHYGFEGIIGASPAMRRAAELAIKVADTDASILVVGETGTGKELFSRALHANSKRAGENLIKVDCGAIPDNLIENELFGHVKGAFTGAVGAAGRFEQADGGTLMLDEVGELSVAAQTRLLRVLEDRVIQKLGGGKAQAIDFRLISATHRDLQAMIDEGGFRSDLFHRLQVVRIRLPSLRERGPEDILRLAEHFANVHGKRHERPVQHIPQATQALLTEYTWPGNVRELSHAIESAVVLADEGVLAPELFPLGGRLHGSPFDDMPTLEELERRYLTWLMDRYDGKKAEISRVAGIGRTTLWRRLKAWGLADDDEAEA